MKPRTKRNILAAAVASFVVAGAMSAMPGTAVAAEAGKVECHGVNSCKGTGKCGGKGHGCAGKNDCKGKGWVSKTDKECKDAGGTTKSEDPKKKT